MGKRSGTDRGLAAQEPLLRLAEQMETLGNAGMAFSPNAMCDAVRTIKEVLCR